MAIRWMVSAWEEKPEVITRRFKHVGMYPDKAEPMEIDADPFAGEEVVVEMEALLSKISTPGQDLHLSDFDDDAEAFEPPIDTCLPNWREILHSQILEEPAEESEEEANDDFHRPLKTPKVNSVKGALRLVKKLVEFSDWQSNKELSRAVSNVKDALLDEQLRSLIQSSIKDYFIKS